MKKVNKKPIDPADCKFYKLDPNKPISAEGYKSLFPWMFLFVSLFFCAILAFIVIVNKDSADITDNKYTVFYAICGTLLGVSLIVFVLYRIRLTLTRKRILNADVTNATVTEIIVTKHTSRDKDGDLRTREEVTLVYEFYDRNGNIHTEKFVKTYNRAPTFYEGQQLIVAFDESECFVLTKYTLLNDDVCESEVANDTDESVNLSGDTIKIDVSKYTPLGYDKRFFILSGIYSVFALVFAFITAYFAVSIKDVYVWLYVVLTGSFLVLFLALAINAAYMPFKTKRNFDSIVSIGATYTYGKLEYTNKVYGNGSKGKYVCSYLDIDGNAKQFKVSAIAAKKLVRRGDTEVIVAYAENKAVALVQNSVVVY